MKAIKNILLMSVILLFSACSKERLSPNGNKISEIRLIPDFKSVNVAVSSPVSIAYGTDFKVELRG